MRFLDSFAMQRTEKEVLTEPSWQYTVDHFILVYVKLEEPIGHLGDHMQKKAGDTQQGKVKINGYKETRGLALCVCYGGKGIIISLGYSTSSNGEESPTVSIRWRQFAFPGPHCPVSCFAASCHSASPAPIFCSRFFFSYAFPTTSHDKVPLSCSRKTPCSSCLGTISCNR